MDQRVDLAPSGRPAGQSGGRQTTRRLSAVLVVFDVGSQQLERLDQENQNLRAEAEISRKDLLTARETLRVHIEGEGGQIQEKWRELKEKEKRVAEKKSHIASYLESLNTAKRNLRNEVAQIDQQLEMALKLSPVQDFLDITEREIDRVDLQLRKTPTLSPVRASLQKALDELYDQKRFLKKSLRQVEGRIDKKRQEILIILESPALQLSPPLLMSDDK